MGFVAAIPVGATQIEIAKRSLNSHRRTAYMVVAGSVSSDMMYGFIALFGVAPFLKSQIVIAIFGLVATLLLWVLAFFTFRGNKKSNPLEINSTALTNHRLSFATGFSLAATNPMMIFWWLIGVKIIRDLGLVTNFTPDKSFIFVVVACLGIASYLTTLTNILHWIKNFISDQMIKKVHFGLGVVLILLSFYFLITSLKILL
jgi:threonine/homoserine/homoserine lactone efflux protein